jgi:hypothetical protein
VQAGRRDEGLPSVREMASVWRTTSENTWPLETTPDSSFRRNGKLNEGGVRGHPGTERVHGKRASIVHPALPRGTGFAVNIAVLITVGIRLNVLAPGFRESARRLATTLMPWDAWLSPPATERLGGVVTMAGRDPQSSGTGGTGTGSGGRGASGDPAPGAQDASSQLSAGTQKPLASQTAPNGQAQGRPQPSLQRVPSQLDWQTHLPFSQVSSLWHSPQLSSHDTTLCPLGRAGVLTLERTGRFLRVFAVAVSQRGKCKSSRRYRSGHQEEGRASIRGRKNRLIRRLDRVAIARASEAKGWRQEGNPCNETTLCQGLRVGADLHLPFPFSEPPCFRRRRPLVQLNVDPKWPVPLIDRPKILRLAAKLRVTIRSRPVASE